MGTKIDITVNRDGELRLENPFSYQKFDLVDKIDIYLDDLPFRIMNFRLSDGLGNQSVLDLGSTKARTVKWIRIDLHTFAPWTKSCNILIIKIEYNLNNTTRISKPLIINMSTGEKTLTFNHNPSDKPIIKTKVSPREECLLLAKECVCGQREQDYGSPEDNFGLIAKLWSDYLGRDISSIDVCMMMNMLKIARIKNGGGTGDSFVDAAGYAACAYEIFKKKEGKF